MQVGTLFLNGPFGRWIYQMTVCDPILKRTAAELVTTHSTRDMQAAFERILGTFPVAIRGAQVDNGSEFRSVFTKLLQKRGIAMQVVQPHSPKQNGCVEHFQRTWRRERYETSSVAATLDGSRRDARLFVVQRS